MTAPAQEAITCRWCGTPGSRADSMSCLRCGAPLGFVTKADDSGWRELPAVPSTARIHFGQSRAQIDGTYVPMVEAKLAAGDGLYFTHDMLLWKDHQIRLANHPMKGAWKRMRGGLPLIMLEAHGPGTIGLSHDTAGELITLPLNTGQGMYVAEHHLLAATTAAKYDAFNTPLWFTFWKSTSDGEEQETEYPIGMYIDGFSAVDKPALVLLHAHGNAFTRVLAAGETINVTPKALVAWAATVNAQLLPEFTGGNQVLLTAQMTGPGLVITQSGAHASVLWLSQYDIAIMRRRGIWSWW